MRAGRDAEEQGVADLAGGARDGDDHLSTLAAFAGRDQGHATGRAA